MAIVISKSQEILHYGIYEWGARPACVNALSPRGYTNSIYPAAVRGCDACLRKAIVARTEWSERLYPAATYLNRGNHGSCA